MTQLIGIRDGHRLIIRVTRQPGGMTVDRRCHPDCPCRATTADRMDRRPARIARRRKPTTR